MSAVRRNSPNTHAAPKAKAAAKKDRLHRRKPVRVVAARPLNRRRRQDHVAEAHHLRRQLMQVLAAAALLAPARTQVHVADCRLVLAPALNRRATSFRPFASRWRSSRVLSASFALR